MTDDAKPGTPAPLVQHGFYELDPTKLSLEGRELLGELQALSRWVASFTRMQAHSKDPQEKTFLGEIIMALSEDAEHVKLVLIELAVKRGAAKHHNPEPETKP